MGSFGVPLEDERTQLDAFVEEYRSALESTLNGLTEEQARRHLVSSATTLLGLLKHVTWMQRVWFEECVGGTSRREIGLVQSAEQSFRLTDDDTVGHRAGPRTLRWVYLQVLRELAHHCGHADILREQVLAG